MENVTEKWGGVVMCGVFDVRVQQLGDFLTPSSNLLLVLSIGLGIYLYRVGDGSIIFIIVTHGCCVGVRKCAHNSTCNPIEKRR
jgi:hypothetical protein